jgi:opacity protein-like surface antigen
MKRTVLTVVGVMLLGASVAAAQAAAAKGSVRFGVGAGLLLPTGDYKTSDGSGWVAGADVTYWLASQPIGLRAEGSYSQTSEASGVTAHKTKIFGGAADVVYAFGKSADQIRPYILAGLGIYNVKVDVTTASASESKIGFGIGGGAAFRVGTGATRVFVEGKYTSVSTSGFKTNFIPIRAGLRFGSK